jgi:2-polyprenyl-6-methoxyphenol hydroxylase-like FAD-dependent oxidoreductase
MRDQVLIVGAGPTGLTAALELSRLGVSVRIIDKLATPPTTSRAVGVQARTLELLQLRGLSEELIRLGNPALAGSIYGGGERVFRLDFTQIDSRYGYLLFVSQAETEQVLRDAIEKHGVVVERNVELVGLSQDLFSNEVNPVKVVLRHADGRLEQAQASYLISAEGAHSMVRTTLDLQFEGKTRDEQYVLGDLHIDGELAHTDFHIFSSEHGFMGLFPMGARRFRLFASNPISTPNKEIAPSLEELQTIYDQRSHIPARFYDMSWSSWFRINSRMVPRLKVGRLLLGGDSAHIHSPAGAQGMNTGIQDMINLSWKLALVLKGHAPASLLDTYEQDRLPVMRNLLAKTEELTGVIGSENPVVRKLFNHLGPWIGGAHLVQEISTARMSQIAVAYHKSPLSANHAHGGGLDAGDRVPDIPVRCRRRRGDDWEDAALFELLDPSRFVLLHVQSPDASFATTELRDAVRPWGDLMRVVELAPRPDEADRARFQAAVGRSAGVFLVRPDSYVGFAGGERAAVRHLGAYCRRWLTATEPARAA